MLESQTVMSQFSEVIPEHLFVQIPEQMERLHAHIGSFQSALEQAPEVFESVGVNLSVNVFFCVVNDLVFVSPRIQSIVGLQGIGVNFASLIDVLPNDGLHLWLAASLCDHSANLSATFEDSDNWNFALETAIFDGAGVTLVVHKASLPADESFVYFDWIPSSAELHKGASLHGQPDSVKHEPCGFLSDAEGASYFVGTHSVFAVRNHPHSDEPLVERQSGILEDGSDLHGELFASVLALALPHPASGYEANFLAPTSGALDAIRPAPRNHELEAVVGVGEVNDSLLEGLWFGAHGVLQ